MKLPKFDYLEPASLAEAVSALRDNRSALPLAGGTDLLVAMKNRLAQPRKLVNLKKIPGLGEISINQGMLTIGALVTMEQLGASPEIQTHALALGEAASRVASLEIRQSATLGGNLALDNRCWNYNRSAWWRSSRYACYKLGGEACYVVKHGKKCFATALADTVPALVALGAQVVICNGEERQLPIEQLFSGKGETPNILKAGELITRVMIPVNQQAATAFVKTANRETLDFPLVNCGVSLVAEEGVCRELVLAVSGVSMAPIKLEGTQSIVGGELSRAGLEDFIETVLKEIKPISNSICLDLSASYRRQLIKKTILEALDKAWDRSQGVSK